MKKDKNTEEKFLQDLKKMEGPFEVPSNYFLNFQERMQKSVKNVPAFESIESLKGKMDEVYVVPENYFEGFKNRILSTLKNKKGKIVSIRKNAIIPMMVQVGMAASLSLLFYFSMPNEPLGTEVLSPEPGIFSSQISKNMEQLEKMDVGEAEIIEGIIKNPIVKKEKKKIYFSEPSIEEMVVTELELNEIIDQL